MLSWIEGVWPTSVKPDCKATRFDASGDCSMAAQIGLYRPCLLFPYSKGN